MDPIASTAFVSPLIRNWIGWPHNENVGATALLMILLTLIGLNIIFDVHLRMLAKHLFGIWAPWSHFGRRLGRGGQCWNCFLLGWMLWGATPALDPFAHLQVGLMGWRRSVGVVLVRSGGPSLLETSVASNLTSSGGILSSHWFVVF